ncbi:hypothetical protein V8E55_006676 [Tylopilus felleus]
MQTGHEEKGSTMFHVRHATAFAGQGNTSRSGEFNTTARSETTKTSSLSTSVSTHASGSGSFSKLSCTIAIGMSGRRSSSGALSLPFRRQRRRRGRDAGHASQHDLLTVVLPTFEYQRPFGTTAAAPFSHCCAECPCGWLDVEDECNRVDGSARGRLCEDVAIDAMGSLKALGRKRLGTIDGMYYVSQTLLE